MNTTTSPNYESDGTRRKRQNVDWNTEDDSNLPELKIVDRNYLESLTPLAEELIQGVLRCGHKMLISGASKAGKSFLLMELAIAIAEGRTWLGLQCKQGRVLYVNLEIDHNSCIHRLSEIYRAMEIEPSGNTDLDVWSLRGQALPLDKLLPYLFRRMRDNTYAAVTIDPIYKVITGDENNASEMAYFCNQFDKICCTTGSAVIYCHHHSKGAQGAKKAMDRASGSGVFARDPDAQLDMIQLDLTEDIRNRVQDKGATAWRLEASLREFPPIKPINFWFEYPIHRVDTVNLNSMFAVGSAQANLQKSGKRTTPEARLEKLTNAFDICAEKGYCRVSEIAEYMGVNERTVKRHLSEFSDVFTVDHFFVTKNDTKNSNEDKGKKDLSTHNDRHRE